MKEETNRKVEDEASAEGGEFGFAKGVLGRADDLFLKGFVEEDLAEEVARELPKVSLLDEEVDEPLVEGTV